MNDFRHTKDFELLARLVLPFDAGDLRDEKRPDERARHVAETRLFGIETNPNATSGGRFVFSLDGLTSHDTRSTYWPVSPRNWETLFYLWRLNHADELAARGFSRRARAFEATNAFDPAPKDPGAFLVWLEWLEEETARREHFERWRAVFAGVLSIGSQREEEWQRFQCDARFDEGEAQLLAAFATLRDQKEAAQ